MRILVIQTAFIGDIVLTTPFLAALQSQWSGAELHVVTTPAGAQILDGLPGIRCHALDKKRDSFFTGLRKVLVSLGDVEFDFVFSVHRSPRSLYLGSRVRAKRRISFRSFAARLLGYETVNYPAYDEATHYKDKPMVLLERITEFKTAAPARPMLAILASDEASAKTKLQALGKTAYVVLSPFSVWGTKMWFADRFARLGVELTKRHKVAIVVVGGTETAAQAIIAQTIAEKISSAGGQVVNLVGQTSLNELKAVIRGAKVLIANDSAPVHIASSFNVPTVAIFGPTAKKWGFFPLSERQKVVEREGLICRPCHIHGPQKCPKGHFRCMDEINVEHVFQAVEDLKL